MQLGVGPSKVSFDFDEIEGVAEIDLERLPDGRDRVTVKVENLTPLTEEEQRPATARTRC